MWFTSTLDNARPRSRRNDLELGKVVEGVEINGDDGRSDPRPGAGEHVGLGAGADDGELAGGDGDGGDADGLAGDELIDLGLEGLLDGGAGALGHLDAGDARIGEREAGAAVYCLDGGAEGEG